MNLLEEIIARKHREVADNKSLYPTRLLERSVHMQAPAVSLRKYIRRPDLSGIVCEFKRQSPSKGMINKYAPVSTVSVEYMQAGGSALSILTDRDFFGGSNQDLTTARNANYCPILRKDFIVDEYQILEARSIGADAILLIAAALPPEDCRRLGAFAKSLGLEVLLEIHEAAELDRLHEHVDVLGVNNRDLRTFHTDIQRSVELLPLLPAELCKISESGIREASDAVTLRHAGFDGFLIGEQFMRSARPGAACARFIKSFQSLLHEN